MARVQPAAGSSILARPRAPRETTWRRAWRATTGALWRLNGTRPVEDIHTADVDLVMRSLYG